MVVEKNPKRNFDAFLDNLVLERGEKLVNCIKSNNIIEYVVILGITLINRGFASLGFFLWKIPEIPE